MTPRLNWITVGYQVVADGTVTDYTDYAAALEAAFGAMAELVQNGRCPTDASDAVRLLQIRALSLGGV
jgi:hypothetical protein